MGMLPVESKNIAANPVTSRAEKILHQMDIRKNVVNKLSDHIKSVVVLED
jgi:hypothetical protein